jgi:hypothetical protein
MTWVTIDADLLLYDGRNPLAGPQFGENAGRHGCFEQNLFEFSLLRSTEP